MHSTSLIQAKNPILLGWTCSNYNIQALIDLSIGWKLVKIKHQIPKVADGKIP